MSCDPVKTVIDIDPELASILQRDEMQKEIKQDIGSALRLQMIKDEAARKSKLRTTQRLIDGVIDQMMKR